MKKINRYLFEQVQKDLAKKMVFIGGPRQVGKTTLAKKILHPILDGYLNWDIPADRESILKQELPNTSIWAFDEIHKYANWRNYLKGIYDLYGDDKKILVTGSAKLDYYRRGGDSLQGRYHYLRLNPLTVKELKITKQNELVDLFVLGGFPEPFFGGEEVEAKRWSREYRSRIIEEELTSLEKVKDLSLIEMMMIRLPDLVGSPLSINSLREDLQVSHKTADRWLNIFCNLYAIFCLPPFGSPILRAVKKEQKHYHYDWNLIKENGPRFENMLAVHLLKWVQYEVDTKACDLQLRYFRDTDGREVDFIITEDNKPIYAIECKYSNKDLSKHLVYFKNRFPECEAFQVSMKSSKEYISKEGVNVISALNFLQKFI